MADIAITGAALDAALAVSDDQDAQIVALLAPFGADPVVARVMGGVATLSVLTNAAWVRNTTSTPRRATLGAFLARTFIAAGTPTHVVFQAGGADQFEVPAGVLSGSASFAGDVTEDSRERLDGLVITATAGLQIAAVGSVHALTFAAPDTATVNVPISITIVSASNVSESWSITPPANFTLSASAGTIAAGATVTITGTAAIAGSYSITLVCAGATITGETQNVVASEPSTGSATPFRLVRTGTQYAYLKDAVEAAADGDVIKCAGGLYNIPAPAGLTLPAPGNYVKPPGFLDLDKHDGIGQPTLTIEWETPGTPMVVDCSGYAAWENSRGGATPGFFMGYECRNLTIRGIHFTGSRAYGNPQHSGIFAAPGYPEVNTDPPELHPAAVLTVEDCKFVQCTDGILTNGNSKFVVNVRRTVFEDCTAGDAYHHIYAGSIEALNIEGCTFLSTAANGLPESNDPAHHVKSRSRSTSILGSFFGGDGVYACAIELPNGGTLVATGNIINHNGTTSASNENAPVRYGAEQIAGSYPSFDARVHDILMAQNTIRKAQPSWNSSPSSRIPALHLRYERMTLEDGTPILPGDFPVVVRNNIQAGIGGPAFVEAYASNSAVDLVDVDLMGVHVGPAIAGSPAVADATLAWAGQNVAPTARDDTFRGAEQLFLRGGHIAVNTWGQVGSSEMADIDPETSATYNPSHPSAAPWRGSNGQASIINAWGSGCWDEANLALWMPLGGGHQNYYGNEAYKQALGSDTAPWSMVIPPTGAVGNIGSLAGNGTDAHFDGQPRSPHTYGNAVYVPGIGPVMPRIAFYDGSATSSQGVWRRNPTTGIAEKVYTFTNNWAPTLGCCYDPTRNRIYSVAQRNDYIPLEYVTPDSGSSWSGGETALRELQHGAYGQLRYIASIDRVAFFTGTTPGVQLAHPTTGAATTLTLNGTMPTFLSWSEARMGVDWCDDLDCLLLWNNGSSLASFATLTPDGDGLTSWTWGTLAPDAGNTVTPPAAAEQGTYGRLIYSAALGGMVLLNSVSSPTVFFATR